MNSLFEEAIVEDWKKRTDESALEQEQIRAVSNPLQYRLNFEQEKDAPNH